MPLTPAPISRLNALTTHLQPPPPAPPAGTMAYPTKDPITCHILDTTTGRPAASVLTTLTCLSAPSHAFTSTTDADGRISKWDLEIPASSSPYKSSSPSKSKSPVPAGETAGQQIASLIQTEAKQDGISVWQLRFNTGAYYGVGKTFWPVVELTFYVKGGEHFHVPLLLGPYSYTTYRGS